MNMNMNMSDDELRRVTQQFGFQAAEARQVAKRLRQLLPQRLAAIKKNGVSTDRRALLDPAYQGFLTEYQEMKHLACQARQQYEVHRMLWDARRSLSSWRRQCL